MINLIKIIALVLGGVALASTSFSPANEADLTNLKTIIENDRQDNGKYKRRNVNVINGIEYEVHEYENYKGEIGYVMYLTKEEDNKIYKKVIATGVEKEDREYDWKLIQDNNQETATTTQ
jgi:hypothetical protein